MLGPMTSEPVAMLHIGCLLKNQWWLANLIYSLSQKKGTHCCIPLKGIMRVGLYFFCNSQFHMSWCSVAKWKCHHMTPCASLDGLTMLITIATAVMANIYDLLKDTTTGRKIKMTRKSHDLWFLLHSIWKRDFNSCYFKTEDQNNLKFFVKFIISIEQASKS